MSYLSRFAVPVTTDAAGAATAYTGKVTLAAQGLLWAVYYVPDATVPLDTGADITITEEDTGKAILTITNLGTVAVEKVPRVQACDPTGAAITGVYDLAAVQGRIKIVVAQGGNAKAGTFYVYVA